MRLWSLHPHYLDVKGLLALWREGLLAQHVLLGKTKGYKHHPQLNRFKATPTPTSTIAYYLSAIVDEADKRHYHFNRDKIICSSTPLCVSVTIGQLEYEWVHLLNKLKLRDPERFKRLSASAKIMPHPMFTIVSGDIEPWEIIA